MKTLPVFIFLSLISTRGHSDPAQAQGENILFPALKGYKMVGQSKQNGIFQRTFMPETETPSTWTEQMIVTVFDQKKVNAQTLAKNVANSFLKECQGGTAGPIAQTTTRGYAEASMVLNCPFDRKTSRPKINGVKAVEGTEKLYVVERIFISALNPKISADLSMFFKSVNACDMRIKERACPELLGNSNPRDVASSDELQAYRLEVKKAVAQNMNDFKTCYRDASARNPSLAGTLDMRWQVDSSGTAANVAVNEQISTITDPELRRCVVDTLVRLRFPTNRFDKAVDVMNYPFKFGHLAQGR